MDDVLRALFDAADLLEQAGIPYAVTGSFASAYHGYVRATEDVDLKVRVEDDRTLDELSRTLPEGIRRIDAATWVFPGDAVVELYPVADRLDEAALDGRVEGELPGEVDRSLWFVPLEALLVLKLREHVRHGHGLKHLADVQQLLARSHDAVDPDVLEDLLGLDPTWRAAWEEEVEPASNP